jgi:hypothetical protein
MIEASAVAFMQYDKPAAAKVRTHLPHLLLAARGPRLNGAPVLLHGLQVHHCVQVLDNLRTKRRYVWQNFRVKPA